MTNHETTRKPGWRYLAVERFNLDAMAIVVDTRKPYKLPGTKEQWRNEFKQLCECPDIKTAVLIACALNHLPEANPVAAERKALADDK